MFCAAEPATPPEKAHVMVYTLPTLLIVNAPAQPAPTVTALPPNKLVPTIVKIPEAAAGQSVNALPD
jgi:hypothetical protein